MYLLRLSSVVRFKNRQGFHSLTDTIGPFHSGDAAQAWFVKNFEWLDTQGVKEVTSSYMDMPRYEP